MTSSIRIAFIGAGRMANHHAGFLQQEPDVAIVAAADIDRARRGIRGKVGRHALSRPLRHARCRGIDAVYICTPTGSHALLGLDVVARNLPLFVEKPLDSRSQARRPLC
ncbi:MAG: Gfo/Idh/MocA family oxidoreductase [Caldilineaceae bacterium]|nr:Gfo/Idh/MocA family oxidoreductase [Caldilineaceae bacterium]